MTRATLFDLFVNNQGEGAALSHPAIAPEVKRLGLVRRTEVLRNG